MLMLQNLTAQLASGQKILNSVSFSAAQGDKIAIIGANGSGKSTLLKALAGLIPVDYLQYHIAREAFSALTLKERARLISYVGQNDQPMEETTVWEWCLLSRFPHNTSALYNEKVIHNALEQMQITQFAGRDLHSLSGGERQRVYLAGALAQETPIIFLDEINAALDPKYRDMIHSTIAGLEDKTILSITHDLNNLDCYSHILALKQGQVLFFGLRDHIDKALLTELFEYDFTEIVHEGEKRFF